MATAHGQAVSSVDDEIERVFREYRIADKQEALVKATEQIFGVHPKLVLGKPDLGEPPYVTFRVCLPPDMVPDVGSQRKISWHKTILALIPESALAVRLIVEYE